MPPRPLWAQGRAVASTSATPAPVPTSHVLRRRARLGAALDQQQDAHSVLPMSCHLCEGSWSSVVFFTPAPGRQPLSRCPAKFLLVKKCWALGLNRGSRAPSIQEAKRSPASWYGGLLWSGGEELWDPVVGEVKARGKSMAGIGLRVQWESRCT